MILKNNMSLEKFKDNPFVIGTTDINEYFPVYNIKNNYLLGESVIKDIFMYHKPLKKSFSDYTYTQYADLFNFIVGGYINGKCSFKMGDVDFEVNCTRGYMAGEDDNILLLLCTNSKEIFTEDDKLNHKNLKLFVSTKLVKNPIYKNIYKKICSDYINKCYEKDVDVMYTTSEKIEELVYSNNIKIEYDNITELKTHLQSGLGDILFTNDLPEPVSSREINLPF